MSSNTGREPASIQLRITQEENPTSYPIYILNGKEVPISRYGKFPPSFRQVKLDSVVILNDEQAAKYGARGQEAGVFLLYDELEGEKPVGRMSRKEMRAVESSLLIKVDNLAKELEVSLDLPSTKMIKVHVLDLENEQVKQMTDSWTWPGEKKFNWKFGEEVSGAYRLKVEVGELVMLRDIKL